MVKKWIIAAVCLSCSSLYAEDKFAHINTVELFNAMPEKVMAESKLEELSKKYEKDISGMTEEYKSKYDKFVKEQASLPEASKEVKMTELQQLQQRLETYQQTAYQDVQKKQMELQAPIAEKIRNAIKAVGDEKGFTFIFDSSNPALLYCASSTVDAMPLVKAKLGLNTSSSTAKSSSSANPTRKAPIKPTVKK